MTTKTRELTARQALFVAEYLVDCNGAAAARRAGYSPRTADRIAGQLLGKTWVAEAIARGMAERAARLGITAERVLRELASIGFIDPREVFGWGPQGIRLKDSAELSERVAACVAEVSQTVSAEGGRITAKLHDKLKALELIARHLGMLNDKLDVPMQWEVLAARLQEGRAKVAAGAQR